MTKISIRFYNDREVRAVWDEKKSKWWFSAVDIVAAITDSPNPRKECAEDSIEESWRQVDYNL